MTAFAFLHLWVAFFVNLYSEGSIFDIEIIFFPSRRKKLKMFFYLYSVPISLNYSRSVVEPEPDFLAGAVAGEKAPAPGCCCLASGYCGVKVP